MLRVKKMRLISAVAAVAAALLLSPLMTPAASADSVSWDWGDNHRLCQNSSSCVRTGNVVRLWQAIVYTAGGQFDLKFIDGDFGPWTKQITRQVWGSPSVEPWMWLNVQNNLRYTSGDCPGSTEYYQLVVTQPGGWDATLSLRMNCQGIWSFLNPRTLSWTGTSH